MYKFKAVRHVVGFMEHRSDVRVDVYINEYAMTMFFYIGDDRHNIGEKDIVLEAVRNYYVNDNTVVKIKWKETKLCKDGKERKYSKCIVSHSLDDYEEVYEMLRHRIRTGEVRSENVEMNW